MINPSIADKSRVRAARALNISLEEYNANADAGKRWCSPGKHWQPKQAFTGFNKRCQDCNTGRRKYRTA